MSRIHENSELAQQVAKRDRTLRRQQELMDERSIILGQLIWSKKLDEDELQRLRSRFDETELEYLALQATFETRH